MTFALRLASAAVFVLAPLSYINAQASTKPVTASAIAPAGKNIAMDFRTTVVTQGQPDTSIISGHAVGSADKMRMDLKMQGPGAQELPFVVQCLRVLGGLLVTLFPLRLVQALLVEVPRGDKVVP